MSLLEDQRDWGENSWVEKEDVSLDKGDSKPF